ncbi:zinc finger BED domain-containing protein RICESLEEPER 2-like [Rhododendron vialii]|uniref:zinc finger BED domain-containing protein RICESLEEPER 2-like n=1 Tax=Rhododendron vialii TaxID=182163 RepID=UPI00265F1FC7|nr:zinc finger BED domain-containing protein RICESLEEPER 2-like [Rhododendron vialii]XP_058226608.1 zinc finger BED domain-containing protein RICESLEEPER 2-like [Rhododendron vialii]XP_058226609.1 zinc finger BED domain-containing protein RICESLEEPER 2-like [Rhododendron vialii]
MSDHELDYELEMDDIDDDDDDVMDDAAEFDIPQNAELNDDQVPEIETKIESKKIVGSISNKRAACWKHFYFITPENHPKPRAACKWCRKDYACHSKLNGTKSLTHHLKFQCLNYPMSKKFTGSRQKQLSFQKKEHNGETSADLVPMTFSVDACKRALAKKIIIDELPFSFVEGEGFKQFIEVVQPMWKPPGRLVMAKNCMLIYGEEKMALKQIVKHQRLCLTTDTWTSVQNLNYMCLTGHFIDDNWKYQKKILNFCVVPNHKGDTLGRMVEQCLLDWGIDKFLTVTVDNASSNSLLIAYLERKTKHRKTTILNHEFLHVRCSAHILNLIVREGLQEIDDPIGRVRNIVRYVRSSPSRMAEFWSCVEKEGITCRLKPCLDVSTRWNYTYFMLERALTYQKAFDRLCDDPSFKLNVREEEIDEAFDDVDGFEGMGRIIEIEKRKKKRGRGRKENVGAPTSSDWGKIKLYVKFLRVFYLATLKFSGSLYVTCNVFFDEMVLIQQDIVKLCETDDSELRDMALGMREKFDKYWGDFDKINQMLMFAVVLDPRCKIGFFEYCFRNTLGYDKTVVGELTDNITNGITRLFEWYVKNNANSNVRSQEVGGSSDKGDLDGVEMEIGSHKSLKSQFKMHMQKETNMACKSNWKSILRKQVRMIVTNLMFCVGGS